MKTKLLNFFYKYGLFLWPSLVFLVMIVLFVKVDLPKIGEIDVTRRELSGIQERLSRLVTKSSLLANQDNRKLQEDLNKINFVLPDGKDAPSILRIVDFAASSSGVTLQKLDLAPGKIASFSAASGEQDILPVQTAVEGRYDQLETFFEKLFHTGRALGLQKAEMTFTETTGSAKLAIDLVAYFLPFPNQEKMKIDDPLPKRSDKEEQILKIIYERELLPPTQTNFPQGKPDVFK
ncbi:MAG: type 4a pilus biogenesis protein PilO [Patescibacteria group bacterium]|nr:type 4a pilus biogenesis protein PilO [Patescibacteria group bacterium]MCL5095427.1 type 4a pilus biogenesis protein PilO [Patescibacteria group bacterium]